MPYPSKIQRQAFPEMMLLTIRVTFIMANCRVRLLIPIPLHAYVSIFTPPN
jgi:hypothetical protein